MRSIRRQNRNLSPIIIFFSVIIFDIVYLLFNGGIYSNLSNLIIDACLFILSFFAFLFFFSIFIFPFTDIKNLFPIFYRVLLFMTGMHGSISQVKNGMMIEKNGISHKNNPGSALLDSSSAAIISKTTQYHRAVGPGIVFTQKNEFIANTISLQPQKQLIGPLEDEDPYSTKRKNEKPESYYSRVQRVSDTKAVTRDGLEIIASFSIFYKIKSKPGEGNSPFGYNPLSVERAILGQSVDLNSNQMNGLAKNWTTLPGHLVVDIWRELINKYKFNELFQVKDTHLEYCIENLRSRLMQQEYEEIDEFGIKTEILIPSKEYRLLQDRGIVILEIRLKRLSFPPEIEEGLINQWESSSMKISNNEQEIISRLQEKAILDGKLYGKKFVTDLISQMTDKLTAEGVLTPKNLINQLRSIHENQSQKRSGILGNQLNNDKRVLS